MSKLRRPRPPDRIARYLFLLRLWAPRQGRAELIAEAHRHLYDAASRAEAAGRSRAAAQRAAVRAFGPAWRIGLASRFDGRLLVLPPAPTLPWPRRRSRPFALPSPRHRSPAWRRVRRTLAGWTRR